MEFWVKYSKSVTTTSFGVNTIQLIAVNLDNNCSDTLVQQVEIHPLPDS